MKETIGKYFPVLLGCLFLYSGGYKLLHPGEAAYALMSLDLHRWPANATVLFITVLELYLGIILMAKVNLRYSLTVSTVLLLMFTAFLWYLTTMAHPPACGCLGLTGMFTSTKKEAISGILRNCLLLWGLRYSYDYYVKPTAASGNVAVQTA
jgi:hypothetical protein